MSTRRHRTIRRVEKQLVKVLHMISRTWKDGAPTGHAFCDGLLIGNAPWLCYCCQKIRYRLEGRPWRDAPRAGPTVRFFCVATHRGHWVWPCVKNIYPNR